MITGLLLLLLAIATGKLFMRFSDREAFAITAMAWEMAGILMFNVLIWIGIIVFLRGAVRAWIS